MGVGWVHGGLRSGFGAAFRVGSGRFGVRLGLRACEECG